MKKTVTLAIALSLALGLGVATATAEGETTGEQVKPMFGSRSWYHLQACQDQSELDCIESFGVIENQSGVAVEVLGTQISFDADSRDVSQTGSKIFGGKTVWRIPATTGEITAPLSVRLESTKTVLGPNHTGGSFFITVNEGVQDFDTKFFVKLRTSWFKPENFTMAAENAEFSQKKIAGGNVWRFAGTKAKIAAYEYRSQEQFDKALKEGGVADFEWSSLHFIGHHIQTDKGKASSFFNDPCSSKGFMVQANNAAGGGMAYWDSSSRSLNFSILAAHRTQDGKLNRGFYRMWVNRDYVQCRWPESGLANAKAFSIGVYNEDGSKQIATTLVAMKKDLLTVAAYNFHYSSPQIRLGKAKASKLHCVSVSDESKAKRVKGKKCPTGFKRFG